MPFKNGHKHSPGGKNGNKGGTGRPPDWFKKECEQALIDSKFTERLEKIAAGEPVMWIMGIAGPVIGKDGFYVLQPANIKDQLRAGEMLADRTYGKPSQQIESSSFDEITEALRKKFDF